MDRNLAKQIVDVNRRARSLTKRRVESLSTTVSDLLQKAVQNEQILRRYQRFELKLLDTVGFVPLLELLLDKSLGYFQLDAVELHLYDPQGTLAELLIDERAFKNLHFVAVSEQLSQFYQEYSQQNAPAVTLVSLIKQTNSGLFVGAEIRSAALLPLIRHGVLVGSLHLGSKGHQRFATDKSTDFINHLAAVVAVCLENAVNQERLQRLSMYDMLTQVKNRRAFQRALESEVSRASRTGDLLSLLFVDLDYFKAINDTHGHQTGDRVLKVVAQHIDQMLRKTDHVCRYGGEEFSLILPNCTKQRAIDVADRIREQVSELRIANDEGVDVSLTLSVGVTCWSPDEGGADKIVADRLVALADEGVYQSKDAGRNATRFIDFKL